MTKSVDWIAIEGAYRAGQKSIREIAKDSGTSEANIRKVAKKSGWVRDPEGTKRQMVRARMSGAQDGAQFAARTLDTETSVDVEDMQLGLKGARGILQSAVDSVGLQGVHIAEDGSELELNIEPKDLKILSECIKINVDTIRKIRGLDEPEAPNKGGVTFVLPSQFDSEDEWEASE